MPDPVTAGDTPLWYKDAVIYQLHVKSFFDGNDDGIGDFAGLISKLDYIADLGVTAVWLLPFYPSPRRDDGYDIALYEGVSPDYGTMEDARRFIEAAHARGLRVITELVVNHTSDQHPWFQAARRAPKGAPERDFYVWADDDQGYAGTPIIFLDIEKSNWSFDPVAGQYYWHRFYAHQPDLNYDNPEVVERVLSVMRFWLDLGVDGLRLDAVPYLVEREGTANENLPETHAILRRFRAHMDAHYTGRMFLAEANVWPEDALAYFGENADECHMAFHFPLMPRMYMAIAREDRFPITDILRQTPPIPDTCQWATFLRNHDELTLAMVTDSERDYLWSVYASDRRARINLGIRRRLAPLLERDRRRIELMHSLLFTMPGTPVLYYGDEIGMGDNIHLGDRDGVRTPMQWSPDRNGGFSRADPESLVLPTIQDPLYGFNALNVEAQARDPHSLLNWTRRMLAVRARHPALRTGDFRQLFPGNRKIFAYLREAQGEAVLCVANLARTLEAVSLDLSDFEHRVPQDLAGGTTLPPVTRAPYTLTLPPYGFYALRLAADVAEPAWHAPAPEQLPEFLTLVVRQDVAEALDERHRAALEADILPAYLARRRWYPASEAGTRAVRLAWALKLERAGHPVMLCAIRAETEAGTRDYLLTLAVAWDDEPLPLQAAELALARIRMGHRMGYLTDALVFDDLPHALVSALKAERAVALPDGGAIRFIPHDGLADMAIANDAPVTRTGMDGSSATLAVGDAVVLKVLRHCAFGDHPATALSAYLTAERFPHMPPLLGEVRRTNPDGGDAVLALLSGFVRNQGDARAWLDAQLRRGLDAAAAPGDGAAQRFESEIAGVAPFLRRAGRRLAEMHAALARAAPHTPFAPHVAGEADVAAWRGAAQDALDAAFVRLADTRDRLDDEARTLADRIAGRRPEILAGLQAAARRGIGTPVIRLHGSLTCGRILVAGDDAIILPGEDRREQAAVTALRHSPWLELAGLQRSLARVSRSALTTQPDGALGPELVARFTALAERSLTAGYAEAAPHPATGRALTDLFALMLTARDIVTAPPGGDGWPSFPLTGFAALCEWAASLPHP